MLRNSRLQKLFLKISQSSQKSTYVGVPFFNKVVGLRGATLLKKKLWHMCFPVNSVKYLRKPSVAAAVF